MIVGIDEVGTGAWAGPFFFGAVSLPDNLQTSLLKEGVVDSKTLTPRGRQDALDIVALHVDYAAVYEVSVAEITKYGHARAYAQALDQVIRNLAATRKITRIIIDGAPLRRLEQIHKTRPLPKRLRNIHYETKADGRFASVAAASNLAKVHRDRRMAELHEIYPEYSWDTNMGYGTAQHRAALDRVGTSKYHRKIRSIQDAPVRKD